MQAFTRRAVAFLSLAVCAYVALAYSLTAPGTLVHPDMRAAFVERADAVRLHAFAALVALALGPWQFSASLRVRRPGLHRLMGRAYLGIGVLVGGLSGLYLAQHAHGGTFARVGFTLLALAWLYSGWRAYTSIRAGNVQAHHEWMTRNFALTFAAVMLRLYVPAAALAGLPFAQSYAAIAWLCWAPNLVVAQWLVRRARRNFSAGSPSLGNTFEEPPHEMAGLSSGGLRRRVRA